MPSAVNHIGAEEHWPTPEAFAISNGRRQTLLKLPNGFGVYVATPGSHRQARCVCRSPEQANNDHFGPRHENTATYIFIGGGLAAVSRTRAARHPERHFFAEKCECSAQVWETNPQLTA
jgi:hypothetical protein